MYSYLGDTTLEHSSQRDAVCCGRCDRRPQPRCGCASVRTRTQGRPAGPVAQTFQSAGCGDFPVPTFGPRNWKVPRTRRLESLRYEASARANPGLEDAALLGQRMATRQVPQRFLSQVTQAMRESTLNSSLFLRGEI